MYPRIITQYCIQISALLQAMPYLYSDKCSSAGYAIPATHAAAQLTIRCLQTSHRKSQFKYLKNSIVLTILWQNSSKICKIHDNKYNSFWFNLFNLILLQAGWPVCHFWLSLRFSVSRKVFSKVICAPGWSFSLCSTPSYDTLSNTTGLSLASPLSENYVIPRLILVLQKIIHLNSKSKPQ